VRIMEKIFKKALPLLILLITATIVSAAQDIIWDFNDSEIGKLPAEWKIDATNPRGKPATWEVVQDTFDGKATLVLGMTRTNVDFGGTFNICRIENMTFLDGEIEVYFKAIKGSEDQGGGIIWRVKDANNYYIARANPLENNFRLYYVKDGARETLDSRKVNIPSNKWHTMKIVHRGKKMAGYLNGQKLLEYEDDTFSGAGGVGVWTKADAITYFDNFTVKHLN